MSLSSPGKPFNGTIKMVTKKSISMNWATAQMHVLLHAASDEDMLNRFGPAVDRDLGVVSLCNSISQSGQKRGSKALLAMEGNKVVGIVVSKEIDENTVAIDRLVHPEYRGRGVGKKMEQEMQILHGMDVAEEQSRYQYMQATVFTTNKPWKDTLERSGWTVTKRASDYYELVKPLFGD